MKWSSPHLLPRLHLFPQLEEFLRHAEVGGELSASRASHRGEGSTGGARRVRWIELTALECSENRLQRETRTFFAFVISFSISSVERLRASSTAGSFICAAAAREATRVVAAETRSPLVETSASASSTRRKSDMTDTLPESPREQKGDPSRSRVFPQCVRSVNVSVRCELSFRWKPPRTRVPLAFPRPGTCVSQLILNPSARARGSKTDATNEYVSLPRSFRIPL